MTLSDLETLARDLRAHMAEATTILERFAAKLDAARAEADPFAALYFAARKDYRYAVRTANKGGAKIERSLISSYKKAMELGFKGSIRDWEGLLRVCLG